MKLKKVFLLCLSLCLVLAFSMYAGATGPVKGGVLKVAAVGQPATLDGHWTTAHTTHGILYQTNETLFAPDEKFAMAPMLAQGYEMSKDGLTLKIKLREGVLFHDGSELDAEDVIASLKRWGDKQGAGKKLFSDVESVTAPSKYVVEFKLKNVVGPIITLLGINQSANPWIYPKESIERAGNGQLKEFIGTGPFQFVEFKPDQHIKLKRFDKYVSRQEEPSGLAGKKVAYVDEIYFNFLPDPSVRAASVEAGESHFAEAVNFDEYPRFKDSDRLVPVVVMPRITVFARMNLKGGALANQKVRQAFIAALDCDDIMRNTIGIEGLYIVSPSLMTSLGVWNSKAGADKYNQKNPELAKKLLKEAGYKGEPIRWLTSKQYPYMYASAMATKPHLEKAGFKVDLQVLEWAQVSTLRKQKDKYEIFSTGIGNTIDPSMWIALDPNWPGWWDTPKKEELREKLWRTPDMESRKKIWGQLQALFYEQVPLATFGETGTLHVISPKLKGLVPHADPFFWNVWIEK